MARSTSKPADYLLLLATLGLLIFGLIMIASIGVPKSIKLSAPEIEFPNCNDAAVNCYLLLKNHAIRLVIGLIALFACSKLTYRFWRKMATPFFLVAFGLLMAVFIFGSRNNTFAQSWINLPSLPFLNSIQPTEIAKLALILYFATWMDKRKEQLSDFKSGFLSFSVLAGIIILPVVLQPDLGSTLVFTLIAVALFFTAGGQVKHLLLAGFVAVIISVVMISNISYLKNRFTAFLVPNESCSEDYCWQAEQASIAIGSGGFWGKGLTQGIQKSYWLPQASDDFIFAASAEEIGFLRILFVLLAYGVIAHRGFKIANGAPDNFSSIAATGITTWIVAQALINIGVNTSLLPITGITLPFVSYGGSSLVTSLMGIGILLNISKHSSDHAHNFGRRRNGGTYIPKYRHS